MSPTPRTGSVLALAWTDYGSAGVGDWRDNGYIRKESNIDMTDKPQTVMQKAVLKNQLERPTLIIGPRIFELYHLMDEGPCGVAIDKAIKTYDKISELDRSVRILSPPEWATAIDIMNYFDDIEHQRPGALLRLDGHFDCPEGKISYWPRDMFQKYGDLVLASQDNHKTTKEILSKLGINSVSVFEDRYLGEGGFVVRNGNLIVIPECLEPNLDVNAELRKRGYELFFLPTFTAKEDIYEHVGVFKPREEHLDMVLNLISSPDGNLLAVVDGNYYRCYFREVDQLVRKLNAKLHIIGSALEASKNATNFIGLPGGKVIMPNGCPSTQKFLEKGLGKSNVVVLDLSDEFFSDNRSGGIRCMSNLIE